MIELVPDPPEKGKEGLVIELVPDPPEKGKEGLSDTSCKNIILWSYCLMYTRSAASLLLSVQVKECVLVSDINFTVT